MNNFDFYNPTKIIFGNNRIDEIGRYVNMYTHTKKILLVISSSAKTNGILNIVIKSLKHHNIESFILDGIVPNPILDCVYKGNEICRKNNIDFVLGIGGASVIDTAKTIAVAAKNDDEIWNLICHPDQIQSALPIGVIITLYGSGTEMTNGAVITNKDVPKKRGYDSQWLFPKFSILDPCALKSVEEKYLFIGMTDMFCHVLEEYFEVTDYDSMSDDFLELLAKKMIYEFKQINSHNYNNSRLMYLSTLAQNKFFSFDKKLGGEWCAHIIAHEFCLKYNCPHGQVVSILLTSWLNYILPEIEHKLVKFGENVFLLDKPSPHDTIQKIKDVFQLLHNPHSLKELNVNVNDIDELASNALTGKQMGKYKLLNLEDVKEIIKGGFDE